MPRLKPTRSTPPAPPSEGRIKPSKNYRFLTEGDPPSEILQDFRRRDGEGIFDRKRKRLLLQKSRIFAAHVAEND